MPEVHRAITSVTQSFGSKPNSSDRVNRDSAIEQKVRMSDHWLGRPPRRPMFEIASFIPPYHSGSPPLVGCGCK
jgi:hypothetical protein